MSLYHEGSRELQDRFDTRRIADRLEEVNVSATFFDFQREPVRTAPMFWLVTPTASPSCRTRAGCPGLCGASARRSWRSPTTTATGCTTASATCSSTRPSASYSSASSAASGGSACRAARACTADLLLAECAGAQLVVRVRAERICLKCPRYVHHLELRECSAYAPRAGHTPPVPDMEAAPRVPRHRAALAAEPTGEEPP